MTTLGMHYLTVNCDTKLNISIRIHFDLSKALNGMWIEENDFAQEQWQGKLDTDIYRYVYMHCPPSSMEIQQFCF